MPVFLLDLLNICYENRNYRKIKKGTAEHDCPFFTNGG